ncbi:MAG: RNA polymerase sigma factor [Verrucomicrobiota bacterium]
MGSNADTSDKDVVRLILETGDSEYFDLLVRRHISKIRSRIFFMTNKDAEADDLVQETFVRAYRKLGSFRHRASFSTWLHRIAMNTVRDHQRRSIRNPVATMEAPPPHATASHEAPDAQAANHELDDAIQDALDTLSSKLKSAIICHVIEGMSVADVASLEKCSQATIYWRIHTARKQLRKTLGEYL